MPSKTMPGYSIPVEKPATLIAAGQGYGYQRREKLSTESLTHSVERDQPSWPTLSTGYTDIARGIFPPGSEFGGSSSLPDLGGRLMRAASQTNVGEAVNTTSRG